jgi:hypothetical protein
MSQPVISEMWYISGANSFHTIIFSLCYLICSKTIVSLVDLSYLSYFSNYTLSWMQKNWNSSRRKSASAARLVQTTGTDSDVVNHWAGLIVGLDWSIILLNSGTEYHLYWLCIAHDPLHSSSYLEFPLPMALLSALFYLYCHSVKFLKG